MADNDDIRALCGLAGADEEITVEELELLGKIAGRAGIAREALNMVTEKTLRDEDFRQRQVDLVMSDLDTALARLLDVARAECPLDSGNLVMLLWRLAAKLDVSPDHFQEVLASAGRAAP
jgi:hypothetical protein